MRHTVTLTERGRGEDDDEIAKRMMVKLKVRVVHEPNGTGLGSRKKHIFTLTMQVTE